MKSNKIEVEGLSIKVFQQRNQDFISLTDIAKKVDQRSEIVIQNWIRNAGTLDFLEAWEELYNPEFDASAFKELRQQAGKVGFILTPTRWIDTTNAIGMFTKAGRGGGTFAHKDIAIEFCTAISPRFKLYVVKEFERLKAEEAKRLSLEWNVKRIIAKANYHIHTEAVREHLIPPLIAGTKKERGVYASEADLLNVALFGMTAREWRQKNPEAPGNLRDSATTEQLLVLSNLESLNAKLIEWDTDQDQRLEILNKTAIEQMEILIRRGTGGQLPSDDHLQLK